MDEFLALAKDAALAAGGIIKKGFGGNMSFHEKTPHELVSEYDLKSEAEIIKRIKGKYPDHGIYSEEAGDLSNDSEYLWVLDPIDGTHNYIYGLPYYGVSIGLLKDGKPVVGVMHTPEDEELVYASRGGGAFINEKRLSVSSRAVEKAYVLYQCPYPYSPKGAYELFEKITANIQAVRIMGCAVVNCRHVAAGAADAYLMHSLHPHDVAAGTLIIQEAGGSVTDFAGKAWGMKSSTFLASNKSIHEKLLELVK